MTDRLKIIDEMPSVRERLARAKILYTDLDGTLLGRGACLLCDGEGRPSLDAATAAVGLNRAGLTATIVSGRNSRQLMEVSRILGWRDFIAELGTIRSYDRGSIRFRDTGDWPEGATPEGEAPFDTIIRIGAIDVLCSLFPGLIEYHDPWHLDREVTHILRGKVDTDKAQSALNELPLPITIIDNGIIHPPRHTLVGVKEVHAYHVVPAGISKPRAILADLAYRGIQPNEAIAIGDSRADLAMADAVGLMVMVSNGLNDPALLSAALERDHEHVVATRASHGSGWRELVDAWLAARG